MQQIKSFLYFLKVIYQQRYVIKKLVVSDFQKKYLGSILGLPWAFIHPAATILVLWLVVNIGLRGGDIGGGLSFLPWFVCGIVPWFFISECINTSSKSLLSYSFLIKQLYFRVGVIPLITIITALIIHLFMVAVLIILLLSYGHMPTIYWIQFPYYLFGAVILLVGFGWLSSAILVFVRDMEQTISIFLTLFFWLTPIIWQHSNLQGRMRLFVDLNPFFYITNGYRETFITNEWFFNNPGLTIYFWGFAFILFLSGALVFQKLKPHFADVL